MDDIRTVDLLARRQELVLLLRGGPSLALAAGGRIDVGKVDYRVLRACGDRNPRLRCCSEHQPRSQALHASISIFTRPTGLPPTRIPGRAG